MPISKQIKAIASLFVGVSFACSGNEDGGHTPSHTGGAAGTSTNAAGTSGVGGSASQGGGESGTAGSSAGGAEAGGAEAGFWCDLSNADVCRCRAGQKPNAAATTSCPSSDCCVRTGGGNRSCACSKPDSLFTCEDVKNYVSGAIVVASCPF